VTHQGRHIKADTSRGDTSSSQVFKGSSNQVFKVIGTGAINRTSEQEKPASKKEQRTADDKEMMVINQVGNDFLCLNAFTSVLRSICSHNQPIRDLMSLLMYD
jgi:hypothetical protein